MCDRNNPRFHFSCLQLGGPPPRQAATWARPSVTLTASTKVIWQKAESLFVSIHHVAVEIYKRMFWLLVRPQISHSPGHLTSQAR